MEKDTHEAVINYLRWQYPNVLFHSDYGAGVKLTMNQAKAQKRIQNGMSWPDIFIAEPRKPYNGLFIELKADGVKLYKKNDDYANDHIKKQNECLIELRRRGYYATFAVGFYQAKEIIDDYLKR